MKNIKRSAHKISPTFIAVVGIVVIAILGYLGRGYFTKPSSVNIMEGEPNPGGIAVSNGKPMLEVLPVSTTDPFDLQFPTQMKLVLNPGGTYVYPTLTTDVMLATGSATTEPTLNPNKIIAATIEFNYDPSQITISNVVKTDYFSNTLSAPVVDTVNKKVRFSLAVAPGTTGKSESGTIATFTIQPKTPGKTNLVFGTYVSPSPVPNLDCNNIGGGVAPATDASICVVKIGYVHPQVVTNTDIRAEGFNFNIYPSLVSWKAIDPNSMTFSFNVPLRVASDIVDDLDVRGDQVNAQDYAQFVLDFNKSGAAGWIRSDIDKSGKVSVADYVILSKEWGL